MEKYVGILKIEIHVPNGILQRVLTRFSSEKSYLEKWQKMYPESKLLILQNTEEFEEFFESFEDYTPVTKQEYEETQRVQKLYEKLMKY